MYIICAEWTPMTRRKAQTFKWAHILDIRWMDSRHRTTKLADGSDAVFEPGPFAIFGR